jgi:nucleotide-binding universal stress UspA family protein
MRSQMGPKAINPIFVATNGSPSSTGAVEEALELAAAEGATVTAILAVSPRIDAPTSPDTGPRRS